LSSFSSFQNKLRALTINAKQRQVAKMKQSTLYDAFTKNKHNFEEIIMS
jgi:hypothetical protein